MNDRNLETVETENEYERKCDVDKEEEHARNATKNKKASVIFAITAVLVVFGLLIVKINMNINGDNWKSEAEQNMYYAASEVLNTDNYVAMRYYGQEDVYQVTNEVVNSLYTLMGNSSSADTVKKYDASKSKKYEVHFSVIQNHKELFSIDVLEDAIVVNKQYEYKADKEEVREFLSVIKTHSYIINRTPVEETSQTEIATENETSEQTTDIYTEVTTKAERSTKSIDIMNPTVALTQIY